MKEQLISFKTAKLAKEKGCELKGVIYEDGGVSLCTQSLLQKWLREEHNLHIEVCSGKGHYYVKHGGIEDMLLQELEILNGKKIKFKTYEEALEKGLQEALKLIK